MTQTPASTDNSRLAGLQFNSESEFDRGVDVLLSKKQPFEVIGFNVLLVPLQSMPRYEKILKGAALSFARVSVAGAAALDTTGLGKR